MQSMSSFLFSCFCFGVHIQVKKAFPRTGFHSLAFRFPPTVVRCLLHGHQAALPVVARGSSGRQGLLLPGDHRTSRGQSQVRFVPSLEAVSVLFYYLNRGVAIALTKRPELAGCLCNWSFFSASTVGWFVFFTPDEAYCKPLNIYALT